MSNSIIQEIQSNSLDNNFPITELLRKAYAVSTKLALSEFREWTANELNGYKGKKVPEYRKIKGTLKCFNPYRGWMPAQIPDRDLENSVSVRPNNQSIAEIEHLLGGDGYLTAQIPGSQQQALQNLFQFEGEFTVFISQARLQGIIDTVRNRILDWSLQLEADGVVGDGIKFTREEMEKAQVTQQNIHISNFQGVLGNTENSNVTQNLNMTVTQGDFEQLVDALRGHQVEFSDISDLKQAIDEDGAVEPNAGFGSKVSGWIGKMVGKAANGSWNVGVAAAGNILGAALSGYYGIS